MAIIQGPDGDLFSPFSFETEKDFEAVVERLADQIFGPSTIFLGTKRRLSGRDLVTIPDGYLIDMADAEKPELFVVEVEVVSHDPFRHVGVQMLKFVTEFEENQRQIRDVLMQEIQRDPAKRARLTAGQGASQHRNIDAYLDEAVYGSFRGLVVIDEARDELHRVIGKIAANISVLEVRTFQNSRGEKIYEFETLYDEEEAGIAEDAQPKVALPAERNERRERQAKSDTVIVPAREEGFRKEFLGNNQWFAIRLSAAMKDRLKYIAAYQVAPVSAVTHIAEIQEIKPYKDTGKYHLVFKGPAREIGPVVSGSLGYSFQGPTYAESERLLRAKELAEVLRLDRKD